MIGFSFGGTHSSEFNLACKSINRTILPERRRKEFVILGNSGTTEFESEEYEKRIIPVQISILNNEGIEKLRERARDIARWLSRGGILVFDDEKNKGYDATVYSAVGLEDLGVSANAIATVEFECQPHAISRELNRVVLDGATSTNFILKSDGNVKTCGVIKIKNTGSSVISDIKIIRKAVIE